MSCRPSWKLLSHGACPALHLTAITGMRRGEVVGLKWSDLDRSTKRLSITRTLQNVGGNPVELDMKTRTSRRCIDIDDGTMDVLARWRRRVTSDGLPHSADDWMFLNAGQFLNPEFVSQLFDRIVKRTASVPRIRSTTMPTPATPTRHCSWPASRRHRRARSVRRR